MLEEVAMEPALREALVKMGRADLIGTGEQHLVPADTATTRSNPTSFKNAVGFKNPAGPIKRLTKRGKK